MPRGILNCSIEGRPFQSYSVGFTGTRAINVAMHDIFTTLVKALDSSAAQSVGIVRRASNYGLATGGSNSINSFTDAGILASSGIGFDRWDESAPAGNNAWALYEFTSAQVPFWVLLQFSARSISTLVTRYDRFGDFPGAPGSTQELSNNAFITTSGNGFQSKNNSVSISVGMMPDGSSPWLGTITNTGSDTKSSPRVWKQNAIKFPRGNDEGAWEAATSDRLIPLIHEISTIQFTDVQGTTVNPIASSYDAFNLLYHVIFDEDDILIFFDVNGQGSAGSIFYFGRYAPNHPGNTIPYVCLFRNSSYDDSYPAFTTAENAETMYIPYGCINTNGIKGNPDDAIYSYFMMPYLGDYTGSRQLINGGVCDPISNHAAGCILVLPPNMSRDTRASLNMLGISNDMRYSVAYPSIYLSEFSNKYGFLGRLSFFKAAKNVRQGHFFSANELIIGNPAMIENKLIIPWDPNTEYGIFGNRYGTVW